jgi:hypothetical protein
MFETFSLRVSVECHGCRISIPLNGVIADSRCYHCGEVNAFDLLFWTRAIEPGVFTNAMQLAPGQTREIASLERGLHVEYGHDAPRCEHCKAQVDLATLESHVNEGGLHCASCGETIPLRAADSLCWALNSGARFVLNEQAPGASGQSLQARTKPVVFQCMSCGGSLRVDGSTRLVSCQFCNNDNYLPDGLWQLLNPVPKPVPFFVVCQYETAEERAERARRAFGQALIGFARDPSDIVRAVVAGNPAAPPAVLADLAQDDFASVRALVAANPATPPTLLEKLAFDRERRVLEGLATNPNLPSHVVDEMAQSDDPEFRALAARHPRLSPSSLPSLARAGVPDANARLQALHAQGVVVEESREQPVRGFFSRLFGG